MSFGLHFRDEECWSPAFVVVVVVVECEVKVEEEAIGVGVDWNDDDA